MQSINTNQPDQPRRVRSWRWILAIASMILLASIIEMLTYKPAS